MRKNGFVETKKADDTQKASAMKKYGYKFPIVPDMVEDLAFNRAITVMIITSLYVVLAFTAVTFAGGKSNVPSAVQVTSRLPNAYLMRSNVSDVRTPRFRLLNSGLGAFSGAKFRMGLTRKFQYSSRGTVPCGDVVLEHPMFADTLEHERVREVCAPVLDGDVTLSNEHGRGPDPFTPNTLHALYSTHSKRIKSRRADEYVMRTRVWCRINLLGPGGGRGVFRQPPRHPWSPRNIRVPGQRRGEVFGGRERQASCRQG